MADDLNFEEKYFPLQKIVSDHAVQIVSSGPDSLDPKIKHLYMKMFSSAQKSIFIQTPYFVPDISVFEVLQNAINSGIEVNLMIPNKPDHPFVYRATEYYASQLADLGANIYIYNNGFLHAKTVVIDEETTSIGSANMDIRSFSLNFEANSIIYSKDLTKNMLEQFSVDKDMSVNADSQYFQRQSLFKKFLQKFSRLLSPLL
jgi:cardiolipin synthase